MERVLGKDRLPLSIFPRCSLHKEVAATAGANPAKIQLMRIPRREKKRLAKLWRAALDELKEQGAWTDGLLTRLEDNSAELQTDIVVAINRWSGSNRFLDEELEPVNYEVQFNYFSGYFRARPLEEQVASLQAIFPTFRFKGNDKVQVLEEGLFAVPRWDGIADTYEEALTRVLYWLNEIYNNRFSSEIKDRLSANYLRSNPRTAAKLKFLAQRYPEVDVDIFPAQLGMRHRGRSIRRAREVFRPEEFGLGAFAVACILITHPDRLRDTNDLWIDCAGDDYAIDGDGDFSSSLSFRVLNGKLSLEVSSLREAGHGYGSATGFLPKE